MDGRLVGWVTRHEVEVRGAKTGLALDVVYLDELFSMWFHTHPPPLFFFLSCIEGRRD